jgi:hypothetical protein
MKAFTQGLVFAAISSMSLSALAKGGESEFWYRPKGGQIAVSLGATSRSMKFEIKQAGAKFADLEIAHMPIGVGVTYGLSEGHAIGLSTDFGTDKTTTKPVAPASSTEAKDTGMSDLVIAYDGSAGPIYFGADLGVSLSKHKEANTNVTPALDGDRSSGGMSLTPSIGYHHSMGSMAFGAKLTYGYLMERTETDQATPEVESKITGGNTISLTPYFEFSHGMGDVAVYFDYSSIADKTTTPTGGTGTDSGARKHTTLGVKGNVDVASMAAIVYDVAYTMVSDFNAAASFDKATGSVMSLGAGVRFTF